MKRQTAGHHIERRVRKGERLRGGDLQGHGQLTPRSFGLCMRDHLLRSIDAVNLPARSDALLGSEFEGAGTAADVEYALARGNAREVQRALTHLPLAA